MGSWTSKGASMVIKYMDSHVSPYDRKTITNQQYITDSLVYYWIQTYSVQKTALPNVI